ncbi:MAG: hypothetical protein AAGI66_05615 [Cyanobacteria bacterium P01_H01_bin.74]
MPPANTTLIKTCFIALSIAAFIGIKASSANLLTLVEHNFERNHFFTASQSAELQKTSPASAVSTAASPKKEKAEKEAAPAEKSKAEIEQAVKEKLAASKIVSPLDLLKAPDDYLDQQIAFTGTFNGFSALGLDYKKAFRDSRDFVAFSVLRPDVTAHKIPLAELKLFFPRKKSTEVTNIESGDVIQVIGKPFSSALGEPWVDVEHIKVVKKAAVKK